MTDANPATEHAPVLEATEARQGRRGKHVLWILVVSLVLVVIALFGAWAMHAKDLASTEVNNGRQHPAAAAFQTPTTPARQNAADAPAAK